MARSNRQVRASWIFADSDGSQKFALFQTGYPQTFEKWALRQKSHGDQASNRFLHWFRCRRYQNLPSGTSY